MNRLAIMLGSRAFATGLSTPLLSTLLMVASAHTAGAASNPFTALTRRATAAVMRPTSVARRMPPRTMDFD